MRRLNVAFLAALGALSTAGPVAGPAAASAPVGMHAAADAGAAAAAGWAGAAPQCTSAPPGQPEITEVPWTAGWFQPERIWSISRGSGVTVAVIDSGVDAQHPQLGGGAVREGFDLVTGRPGGDGDCDSHGTAVASIIAARRASGVGFVGLAPAATILPLRIAERGVAPDPTARRSPIDPGLFAAALRRAADGGARVINASVVFTTDHAEIAEAVRHAQGRGAIVVAAVGNHHDPAAIGPDAAPYPAAYPGVIGVGAVAEDGTLVPTSYVGPHVDLVAPGSAIVAATRGSGHARWTGTSFAAPFVSATAALVIARDRSRSSTDVVRRLLATADPPAGGAGYGHGVVNPYRALTERVVDEEPIAGAPLPPVRQDPAVLAEARRDSRTRRLAVLVSAILVGLALVVAAAVVARRTARPRGAVGDALPGAGRLPGLGGIESRPTG